LKIEPKDVEKNKKSDWTSDTEDWINITGLSICLVPFCWRETGQKVLPSSTVGMPMLYD
jgi:hypothetical protein